MKIDGATLIGRDDRHGRDTFLAISATTGAPLYPAFRESDAADVAAACDLADRAFQTFNELQPEARAQFLVCIGAQIMALGDELIERAMLETGLPRGRLEGERTRTVRQLEFFAAIVREGGWINATIDPARPGQLPAPRPDLRRRHSGLGPVAVFGASNFPLAFSVAGGDSASAWAAGCPVIVKGHPAHPGTGEAVARAVRAAVQKCALPDGVFSYLPGTTHLLGARLVGDRRIRAVGFTGSRAGGLALVQVAAARVEPIPVYAEMSSINPVLLLPHAAKARGAALGKAYVNSVTLGAGQFCTNPGLLVYLDGTDMSAFLDAAMATMQESVAQPMLTPGISAAFDRGVRNLQGHPAVRSLVHGPSSDNQGHAQAALFTVDSADFIAEALLHGEVFGPSSLMVRARDLNDMAKVLEGLEGQLTATVLFDDEDSGLVQGLLPHLERKVGRIIGNGWPTGVEVSHAMVHGGPYPATSDVRTTSVGALAIERFLRPICYQNLPDSLLPAALRDSNPLGLARRVDGVMGSHSAA